MNPKLKASIFTVFTPEPGDSVLGSTGLGAGGGVEDAFTLHAGLGGGGGVAGLYLGVPKSAGEGDVVGAPALNTGVAKEGFKPGLSSGLPKSLDCGVTWGACGGGIATVGSGAA